MSEMATLPWGKMIKKPGGKSKTPLIYFGGKTNSAQWIIGHFPQHKIYVEVFGGGGAILFAKSRSEVDIYNDIGTVSTFFRVLRDKGDMVYRSLYFTSYGREDFKYCTENWQRFLEEGNELEFARCWFTQISQSYTHQEDDHSFCVSKLANAASALAAHVDDFPIIIDRLRNTIIENKDFEDVIRTYDGPDVLFYCDPPYIGSSRTSVGDYRNEMSEDEHMRLLRLITGKGGFQPRGQFVVSGYHSDLYSGYLQAPEWIMHEKTTISKIRNSSQLDPNNTRTEVLWVKSHHGESIWSWAEKQQQT